MTNRTAASRYARALFDVAVKEKQDLDAIDRDLAGFHDLIKAAAVSSKRCCSIRPCRRRASGPRSPR